jgi:hypothetical protein
MAFEPPCFQCIGRENTRLAPYRFSRLTGRRAVEIPERPLPTFR